MMNTMEFVTVILFGLFLGIGIAVQSYFMYKSLRLIAILKAAPDVVSAKSMLKLDAKKSKDETQSETKRGFSPDELNSKALENLRIKQGFSSSKK